MNSLIINYLQTLIYMHYYIIFGTLANNTDMPLLSKMPNTTTKIFPMYIACKLQYEHPIICVNCLYVSPEL